MFVPAGCSRGCPLAARDATVRVRPAGCSGTGEPCPNSPRSSARGCAARTRSARTDPPSCNAPSRRQASASDRPARPAPERRLREPWPEPCWARPPGVPVRALAESLARVAVGVPSSAQRSSECPLEPLRRRMACRASRRRQARKRVSTRKLQTPCSPGERSSPGPLPSSATLPVWWEARCPLALQRAVPALEVKPPRSTSRRRRSIASRLLLQADDSRGSRPQRSQRGSRRLQRPIRSFATRAPQPGAPWVRAWPRKPLRWMPRRQQEARAWPPASRASERVRSGAVQSRCCWEASTQMSTSAKKPLLAQPSTQHRSARRILRLADSRCRRRCISSDDPPPRPGVRSAALGRA